MNLSQSWNSDIATNRCKINWVIGARFRSSQKTKLGRSIASIAFWINIMH